MVMIIEQYTLHDSSKGLIDQVVFGAYLWNIDFSSSGTLQVAVIKMASPARPEVLQQCTVFQGTPMYHRLFPCYHGACRACGLLSSLLSIIGSWQPKLSRARLSRSWEPGVREGGSRTCVGRSFLRALTIPTVSRFTLPSHCFLPVHPSAESPSPGCRSVFGILPQPSTSFVTTYLTSLKGSSQGGTVNLLDLQQKQLQGSIPYINGLRAASQLGPSHVWGNVTILPAHDLEAALSNAWLILEVGLPGGIRALDRC